MLEEGRINGLSIVERSQDAFLGPEYKNGPIFAKVTFGAKDINMTGITQVSLLGMSMQSDVCVGIKGMETRVKAHLSESAKPIIDDITLTRLDGVRIDLPGFGGVSVVADLAIKGLVFFFEESLKDIIERNLLKFANIAIHHHHFKLT